MQSYKAEFIDFTVRCGALTFGDFVTKSGRRTPYFINTGLFDTGEKIARLGEFYANALMENLSGEFDCLFGPAYKGIPLAVAASAALARQHGKNVAFSFNRKEAKDHGEGGAIVGHKLRPGERIVIVEDVTTAGTSVRESVPLLRAAASVQVVGLVISVDRQERGLTDQGALAELRDEFGLKTFAIATIDEIVKHLRANPVDGRIVIDDEVFGRIEEYRRQYGARG